MVRNNESAAAQEAQQSAYAWPEGAMARRVRSRSAALTGRSLVAGRLAMIPAAVLPLTIFVGLAPQRRATLERLAEVNSEGLASLGVSAAFFVHYIMAVDVALYLAWAIIAATLVWHRSDDWLLLMVAALFLCVPVAVTRPEDLAWSVSDPWMRAVAVAGAPIITILATFALIAFPDGRLVPRNWAVLFSVSSMLVIVRYLMFPQFSRPDGIGAPVDPEISAVRSIALYAMAMSGLFVGAWAQRYRWLHVSDPEQRQKTKWIQLGGAISFFGVVLFQLPALMLPEVREPGATRVAYAMIGLPGFYFSLSCLPVAICLSALRYRLWDIDAVINRSLVYATLTAVLLFIYLASIGILQSFVRILTGEQSTAVVVASTLAIALLFHPLRQKIQQGIDRALYPKTVDLREAIATFAHEIRTLIGLPALLENLVHRTADLLEVKHAAVYLRRPGEPPDGGGLELAATRDLGNDDAKMLRTSDSAEDWSNLLEDLGHGRIVSRPSHQVFPLLVPLLTPQRSSHSEQSLVGVLAVGPRLDNAGYSHDEKATIMGLAEQAGTALHVARLNQARQEEERRSEAAEAANAAKTSFFAAMSHEIRTPLNAVIGMTSLLLDSKLDRDQRECADTIRTSSETLLQLINSVLDFSRIESGRLELENATFDLSECIEAAMDLAAAAANEKRIDLSYQIDSDVPHFLIGDGNRIRQIVTNFTTNAVKFTERGSVSIHARLVSSEEDLEDRVRIELGVHDTGAGIPPDRIRGLFEPFMQLEASTQRKFGGSGLGLAISKQLAELMGGTVWAESTGRDGDGSTFYCSIPLQPAGEVDASDRADLPPLRGRRATVALPDQPTRAIVQRILEEVGFTAEIGDVLPGTDDSPDLLVVEEEELEQARRAAGTRDLRVIALRYASELNGDPIDEHSAFLTRPVKPRALVRAVRRVFSLPKDSHSNEQEPAFDRSLAERYPLRLLLAEDVTVNQLLATKLLAKMGYRVDIAGNGIEALEALRRQDYDVVFLDMQMPVMDGIATARRIADSWPEQRRPWMIALTANALSGDREKCLAAGMSDFLTKPIRVGELKAALVRAGERRRRAAPGNPAASAVQSGDATPMLDRSVLAELRATLDDHDADDFIQSLITDYSEKSPSFVEQMRAAVNSDDHESWVLAAHTLKGQSGLIGALRVSLLCQRLEQLGWPPSPDDTDAALRELEKALGEARDQLHKAPRTAPPA